ncbi:MAG TPA: FUSC family protein [Bacteroidia bacterium]|nr:FUSC family protein [Bacteroidia bacterium]
MKLSITKQDWLYVLKCTLGAAICYGLYVAFPQFPFFWSIISVALVVSPENDTKLPYLRMEGNLVGSVIGLLVFFIPLPTIFLLCIGITLTILTGFSLNLKTSVRTAVAATIIVLFQEQSAHSWNVALQRVGCVLAGCVVGFIITIVFTKLEKVTEKKKAPNNPCSE